MRYLALCFAVLVAGVLGAAAQDVPTGRALDEGDSNTNMSPPSPFAGGMSQSDASAFRRWFDNARMMNRRASASDRNDAAILAGKIGLSCTPADAALVGIQYDSDNAVAGRIFEVACTDGVGYLLVAPAHGSGFGLSCFSIDAARREAKDKSQSVACALPANADVKTMAEAAAHQAGTECLPRDIHWIGEGTKSKMDFTELACTDGRGYVLAAPLPGAQSPPWVMGCAQAATRGIACTLGEAN